jgi:glucose-6-phosphate isomerase
VELAYRLVEQYKSERRNITVLMPYSQRLKTFSAWFTQLWAESLGKNGQGITPVPAVGATDQHSILQLLQDGPLDKVTGFIEVTGFDNVMDLRWTGPDLASTELLRGVTMNQLMDAELNATRQALGNAKKPHFTIALSRLNANTLGQLFFLAQTLTAVAGYALGVNPFDQPGVEEGKKLTRERLAACKKSMMP